MQGAQVQSLVGGLRSCMPCVVQPKKIKDKENASCGGGWGAEFVKRKRYTSQSIKTAKVRLYLGEGNGTTLKYSCLENPMDGGVW